MRRSIYYVIFDVGVITLLYLIFSLFFYFDIQYLKKNDS